MASQLHGDKVPADLIQFLLSMTHTPRHAAAGGNNIVQRDEATVLFLAETIYHSSCQLGFGSS